jgi:hypothetical protein
VVGGAVIPSPLAGGSGYFLSQWLAGRRDQIFPHFPSLRILPHMDNAYTQITLSSYPRSNESFKIKSQQLQATNKYVNTNMQN